MDMPNILWICTDQQRWDTLGCYGNNFVNTPNLDKIAAEGVMFDQCYSQSPVCTPSRASFLTGRYPRTARCYQNGQDIPESEILLTKLLADAGYNCGLSGKLHISACDSALRAKEKRIDDGYNEFHWSHHPAADSWGNNNEYTKWLKQNGLKYETSVYPDSKYIRVGMPEEYHQTTWCVEKAMDFIDKYKKSDKPWLFSVNIYDPHHPFDAPNSCLKRYLNRLDELPLPDYTEGELNEKSTWQRIDHNGAYGGRGEAWAQMTKQDHRLIKASYYAMCDLIDKQLGRLFDKLEKEGLRENTIVIFMSDHGEMLGDHGIYRKGPYLYDPAIRVPLIISWPGIFNPLQYSGLIELTDLAPTLLNAAGLPVHEGIQGKSLLDILLGIDSGCHRNDVYCEYYDAMPWHKENIPNLSMLRTKRYKITAFHETDDGELYDLYNDPFEKNNLWNNPDCTKVKLKMLVALLNRVALTVDPLPVRKANW